MLRFFKKKKVLGGNKSQIFYWSQNAGRGDRMGGGLVQILRLEINTTQHKTQRPVSSGIILQVFVALRLLRL